MITFSESQLAQFAAATDGEVIQPCLNPDRHWIEIELLGEDDIGIPDESYEIMLPDNSLVKGKLDQDGIARIEWASPAGQCEVCFPGLDRRAWVPLDSKGTGSGLG